MSPMWNSPAGKHIGVLPAQQPPDWTDITAPPRAAHSRRIASRAAGAALMRASNRLGHHGPQNRPSGLVL